VSFSTSIRIRVTPQLKALARKRALEARSSVSEMVRRMIEAGESPAPHPSIPERPAKKNADPPARSGRVRRETDDGVRAELRRLGGLLKHLAPGGKPWASEEDRRRWWRVTENIEALGRGRRPPHEIEPVPPAKAKRGEPIPPSGN
jgi:hypothetical protein